METTLNIDKSFIYSTGQIENDKPELGLLHYNSHQNYVQIFLNIEVWWYAFKEFVEPFVRATEDGDEGDIDEAASKRLLLVTELVMILWKSFNSTFIDNRNQNFFF